MTRPVRYFVWFFLILLLVFRYFSTRPNYHKADKIRMTTTVLSEPFIYSSSQQLILSGLKVVLPLYPEIHYGDKIVVEGVVQNGELTKAKLIKIKETKTLFYQARAKIISFYQQSLPEPHASLLAGMVLGSKANLPFDFWTALKKTGTAHVVVASGMNISLISGPLMVFLVLFMPRRKAIPIIIVCLGVYSLISGLQAPIIRAWIMAGITLFAQEMGRLVSAWRALTLSALIMLAVNPAWISDLGFILSFVATASLIIFEARVSSLISFLPDILREGFSTSLAAQIGVAPILFVTFGYFNILSPLINALVLWTVAPITMIGMLSGLIGLISPFLGKLLLYLTYPLTLWFIGIVGIFS